MPNFRNMIYLLVGLVCSCKNNILMQCHRSKYIEIYLWLHLGNSNLDVSRLNIHQNLCNSDHKESTLAAKFEVFFSFKYQKFRVRVNHTITQNQHNRHNCTKLMILISVLYQNAFTYRTGLAIKEFWDICAILFEDLKLRKCRSN